MRSVLRVDDVIAVRWLPSALTRRAGSATRRGHAVVGARTIRAAPRLSCRKAGSSRSKALWRRRIMCPNGAMVRRNLARSERRAVSAVGRAHGRSWKLNPRSSVRQQGVRSRSICGAGSPSRKAQRVGDMGKPAVAPLVCVKSHRGQKPRCFRGGLRRANHRPLRGSRRSEAMPCGAASTAWGAHRMKNADESGDRSHSGARDRKSVV